jgi:ferredoxin
MIETAKKPFQEVLHALDGFHRLGIVGCDGCAKVCHTGGSDEVAGLAAQLTEQAKTIIFAAAPERPCQAAAAKAALEPLQDRLQACDALLILGCGLALQIIYYITETLGVALPLKSGLKTLGPMEMPGSSDPVQ